MKAPKKTKAQWQRRQREAMTALNEIEQTERARRVRSLMGKCFRYINSYGSDSAWPLYGRIIGADEYGWMRMFQFETTSNDEIQIRTNRQQTHMSGWEEIPVAEFEEEWTALQSRVAHLTTRPAR